MASILFFLQFILLFYTHFKKEHYSFILLFLLIRETILKIINNTSPKKRDIGINVKGAKTTAVSLETLLLTVFHSLVISSPSINPLELISYFNNFF